MLSTFDTKDVAVTKSALLVGVHDKMILHLHFIVGPNLMVNWGQGGANHMTQKFYVTNSVYIYSCCMFACVWRNSHGRLFHCCGVNEILLVYFLFV